MSVLNHLPGHGPARRLLAALRCPHHACAGGAAAAAAWAPRWLGEVHTTAVRDASVDLRVLNGSAWPRTVVVELAPTRAAADPPVLELAPHAGGRVRLVPLPDEGGTPFDVLVRLRGAHEHQLRWVAAPGRGRPRCAEVLVADAPVLVHGWRDHFATHPPAP